MSHKRFNLVVFLVTLIAPILAVIMFLLLGMWRMDRDLRSHREQLLIACTPETLAALEQWAQPLIGTSEWPRGVQKTLPAGLAALPAIHGAMPVRDDQKRTAAVLLMCGGADNHYGLIIGFDESPPRAPFEIRKQLGDHVWFYDEVSGLYKD